MQTEQQSERLCEDWQALRKACFKQHPGGPGGAAMCYCGRGCGGSAACSMLRALAEFLTALEPEAVPPQYRDWIATLQRVV